MVTRKQAPSKSRLLSQMQTTRSGLLKQVAALPSEKQDVPFVGIWSAKDLVAHLIGWDYANLEAAGHVLAGQLPPFYRHHDRDWRSYNAMLVAKYRSERLARELARAKESQLRLLEYLRTVPPELLSKDFGVRFRGFKVTIARLLQAEIADEQVHCEQVRAFSKIR